MPRKLFLAAALTFIVLAAPSDVGADAPTLTAVTQAWKQTQEKVRSAHFQWNTDQWQATGSQTPPGSDATIPEQDTIFTRKKTFTFSDGRVRYEDHGSTWDPRKEQYLEQKQIYTWNGEEATSYHGDADPPYEFLYDANVELAGDSDVAPIRFAFRMFQPHWYVFDESKFVVSEEPVFVDGRECWNIEHAPKVIQERVVKGLQPLTPVFTVCPDRNYAVVRYAAINKATGEPTLTMELSQTADGELSMYVPTKWIITFHGRAGAFKRLTSTVLDYTINEQVTNDTFSVELPAGTRVSDMRSVRNTE